MRVNGGGRVMVYFVALPFTRVDEGGLAPGEAIECPSDSAAVRRAEAMSSSDKHAGAVAFSRRGDLDVGDAVLKRWANSAIDVCP
jgi:hypothetical protein